MSGDLYIQNRKISYFSIDHLQSSDPVSLTAIIDRYISA